VTEHTVNTRPQLCSTGSGDSETVGLTYVNQFRATKTGIIQHQDTAAGFGEPFLFGTLGNGCFFLGHFNIT